jgi:phasin family protein
MTDDEFDAALVTAAFSLGAERGWRNVTAAAAARFAGLDFSAARTRFTRQGAILAKFGQLADAYALSGAVTEGPVKDRLFDIILRRFDFLQRHRAGVIALLRTLPLDPPLAAWLAKQSLRSMGWLLEGAGIAATGARGEIRKRGLGLVWGCAPGCATKPRIYPPPWPRWMLLWRAPIRSPHASPAVMVLHPRPLKPEQVSLNCLRRRRIDHNNQQGTHPMADKKSSMTATPAFPPAFVTDFDFKKIFSDMKVPPMPDMEAVLSAHKRNLEALSEANRVALEGAQAVARRHMEIMQSTMAGLTDTLKSMAVNEAPASRAAKQAELLKQAYENAVSNTRELGDLIQKSNSEAMGKLNHRFSEAMTEMKTLFKKP